MAGVGIVGGLGVGATIHYYGKITAACKARGIVPDLTIVHADVDLGQGLVRASKLDELAAYLATFIERLRLAGATAAVLPAVTPHICLSRLTPLSSLPLISIVEPTAAELQSRGLKKVALFGTSFTMEGGLWGLLKDVEIVKPTPDEIAFIGKVYQRLLDTQHGDAGDLEGLRRIAADLQRRANVETILFAGTDFAVLLDEETAGFPALDMARLHIDAIVQRLAAA
jgi:aspartate racemase